MSASAIERPGHRQSIPHSTYGQALRKAPSRRIGNLAAFVAGLGAGITAAFTLPSISHTNWSTLGALANAVGIATAMLGTYLALLAILLMARLPWLEHEVGQDRITAWHRKLGPWTLVLIVLHVIFSTLGYAQMVNVAWLDELIQLTFGTAWMLPAMAATLMMIGLGVISWRRIRARMKYETWHTAHLFFYLAVALAFGHQIETGSIFIDAPLAQAWWIGLYIAVVGAILLFRIAPPIVQSIRHDLRVAGVEVVDSTTSHVYVSGRNLDRLGAQGGQWFSFRFGTRHWCWQGHPYSLSALPQKNLMRITVKKLGDESGRVGELRTGTRVFAEGPYGAFRSDRRETDRVVMIGAGVGVTPIRAMLDDLPSQVHAVVLYRAHQEPAPLADELRALTARSGGRIQLRILTGTRKQFPMSSAMLGTLIPGIQGADIYMCGPTGFVETVRTSVLQLGVPKRRIHDELFEF